MNNRTNEKDPDNRYEEGLSELEKLICPIWQGWQDSKHIEEFESDMYVDVDSVRRLMDEDNDLRRDRP